MPPEIATSPEGPDEASPLDTRTEPEVAPERDDKEASLPSKFNDPPTLPSDEEPP